MGGLKFVASMFRMAIQEINNIMGQESLQTIFRLMGERVGESIAKRINATTPEDFAEKIKTDVLEPALGKGGAEITLNGDEISVILKKCPFEAAGIEIKTRFYCTYTEGLVETVSKNSLGNVEIVSEKLRAVDNCDCSFKIKLKP